MIKNRLKPEIAIKKKVKEYKLKEQTACVMQKDSEVYLWNKGPGEENLVNSYLSLLEDEDINQLAEIYRWAI